MYVERVLCPIKSLGPGNRLVLWTKGCGKNCINCASPEMASIKNAKEVSIEDLFRMISNIYEMEKFNGITISGGDPFEQISELIQLIKKLRLLTDDILVYTGFVWDEFKLTINENLKNEIEKNISVLIDGPYIDELNISDVVLRGSSNQKIIYFDNTKKETYEKYLLEGRKLQNLMVDEKMLTVGIMNR